MRIEIENRKFNKHWKYREKKIKKKSSKSVEIIQDYIRVFSKVCKCHSEEAIQCTNVVSMYKNIWHTNKNKITSPLPHLKKGKPSFHLFSFKKKKKNYKLN